MTTVLTPEEFAALQRLDACGLSNAIETFRERLCNEGFVDNTVRCMFPRLPPMLGYAATVRIRGSLPPTASGRYPDRTDWWDYILSLPAPRVVVIQDQSTRPGLGSLIGAVHMNILRALGCTGVVTNGSVRDLPAAESARFHLFAGSVSVSHAYIHMVGMGDPVEIGGTTITSGALIHGDMHGVQTVPMDIAPRIPEVAARIAAEKEKLIKICRSPSFTVEELRAALATLETQH